MHFKPYNLLVMKHLKLFIIIITLSALSSCVGIYEDGKELASVVGNKVEGITVEELEAKIEAGEEFYLLDIRQKNEYKDGNIEGSFNIPRGILEFKIRDTTFWQDQMFYSPLDTSEIIIYCKAGDRGTLATYALQQLGFTNVKNLSGGMKAWEEKDANEVAETEDSKFEILKQYLIDNNLDLNNILDKWIVPASDVKENQDDYYIIDIRKPEDFDAGHIAGALNSSLANIIDDVKANEPTKKILVTCYTGQNAAHAVVALRMSGYADAQVLKFGMSSWNTDFAQKWNDNIGDVAIDNPNWVTTETNPVQDFNPPEIISEKTTGEEILAEQILLLTEFKGVTNTDVFESLDNYFINNFWAEEDVSHYGHIEGAYRLKPLTIANGEYLNLDPDKTIVTYCWTGQTSSMVTAYLRILGYNAISLKFGANGMIHSKLESHKWKTEMPGEFDYEKN